MILTVVVQSFSTIMSGLRFVPRVKTNVRTGAFSAAAPTLWNSLPISVKSVGNIRNIATFRRNAHDFKA